MSARQPVVVTEFVDRYGDKRTIHRSRRGDLQIKNRSDTVALTLNRVAAVEVGKRIRAAREAAGMSLEDLCIRAGLASATPKQRMWELENAIRQQGMRLGTLYAIAHALRVPITTFLPSADEIAEIAGVKLAISQPTLTVASVA